MFKISRANALSISLSKAFCIVQGRSGTRIRTAISDPLPRPRFCARYSTRSWFIAWWYRPQRRGRWEREDVCHARWPESQWKLFCPLLELRERAAISRGVSSPLAGASPTGKQAFCVCADWKGEPRDRVLGVHAVTWPFTPPRGLALRLPRWLRLGGDGISVGSVPGHPSLVAARWIGVVSEEAQLPAGPVGGKLGGVEGAACVSATPDWVHAGLRWTSRNCLGRCTEENGLESGRRPWREETGHRSYCPGACRCPHAKPSLQVS